MFIIAEINYDNTLMKKVVKKFEECGLNAKISFVDDIRKFCGCSKLSADEPKRKALPKKTSGAKPIPNNYLSQPRHTPETEINALDLMQHHAIIKQEIDDDFCKMEEDEETSIPIVLESKSAARIPVSNAGTSTTTTTTDHKEQLELLKPKSRFYSKIPNLKRTDSEMLSDLHTYKRSNYMNNFEQCQLCFERVELGRRPAVYGAIRLEHAKGHIVDPKGEIAADNVDLILLTEQCFPFEKQLSDVKTKPRAQAKRKASSSSPNNVCQMHCQLCTKDVDMGLAVSLDGICDQIVAHSKTHLEKANTYRKEILAKVLPTVINECFPEMNMHRAEEKESVDDTNGTSSVNAILRTLVEDAIMQREK